MPKDDVERESFLIISMNFLLVYENKHYLQVYLDNCAYKTLNIEILGYLDDNLFGTDED